MGGYHPPTYFDNRYEDQWITHPLTVEMIRDNCAKWIVRLGKQDDLTINLHHVMNFSSVPEFEAVIVNTGVVVHSYREYLEEAIKIKER